MLDKQIPVITLDGPSGTGKGTLCHLLGHHLGWNILDSGAIYRVLAYAASLRHIKTNAISDLVELAYSLNLRFQATQTQEIQVFLDEEAVNKPIRSEQCGQDASIIAAIPEVRAALLERQRLFAKAPGLVTDGRDMGTVVFPNAPLKIYLDASPEERAKRRYLQLKKNGINATLAQVVEELTQRDARDATRNHSPLMPAKDAILIDTTGLTIEQVFQKVLHLVNETFAATSGALPSS